VRQRLMIIDCVHTVESAGYVCIKQKSPHLLSKKWGFKKQSIFKL